MTHAIRSHSDLAVPHELARWESSEHPVLSVYADWRVSGRGLHEAVTELRKGLHEGQHAVAARGAAHESFEADAARIGEFLREAPPDARGLAVFACHGRRLWHVVRLALPVPTTVHLGERPALLPLAEATQDAARGLVALADTTRLRLIALEHPAPREVAGFEQETWEGAHSASRTGWRSMHEQRAYQTELERVAHRVADAIADAARQAGFVRIVLAGEEAIVSEVRGALPDELREEVVAVAHVDIRATVHEVAERIWPVVAQRAREQREREALEMLEHAEGTLNATFVPEQAREMLVAGRVDTLAMDPDVVDPGDAEVFLHDALAHRSRVLIVRGVPRLRDTGGVVVTLR